MSLYWVAYFLKCNQLFPRFRVTGELGSPSLLTQELLLNPLWVRLWILNGWHHTWHTAGARHVFVALMILKMADRRDDPCESWMWAQTDLALVLK